MILNGTSFNRIPVHWGFSTFHVDDLCKINTAFWKNIKSFHNNTLICPLLSKIRESADIFKLIRELPVFSPIIKDQNTYYSLFDDDTIYSMYMYLWYSSIYEYVNAANSKESVIAEVEEKKRAIRSENKEFDDESVRNQGVIETIEENGIDYELGMQEIEIRMGNKEDMKSQVAALILAFVGITQETKTTANLSYSEIMRKIKRTRKQEKDKITKYLGEMDEDERRIEDQFKKYKMGRWNVGMQKGLVHYDVETYEREREGLDDELFQPAETNVDVMLEEDYRNDAPNEADGEGEDITQFGENYMDGQYYDEDRDELDFGDE